MLRDGQVLAAADIADGLVDRSKGLAGRQRYEGVLVVTPALPVHSMGARFSLDVAFLNEHLVVMDVFRLSPWRLARPRLRSRVALQAPAGCFERWRLTVGDMVEVREVDSGPRGGPPIFPTP